MTKTVIYDIEAAQAVTATAQDLLKYQLDLLDKIAGFKTGEMIIYSVRRTGKSMYYNAFNKNRIYYDNLCKEIMLPEPKYKFSRAKWYEADMFNRGLSREMREWCIEHFGPLPKNPDAWSRWTNQWNSTFRFRDAQDYEWFMLRWS
jgi:hypothetical protein